MLSTRVIFPLSGSSAIDSLTDGNSVNYFVVTTCVLIDSLTFMVGISVYFVVGGIFALLP